VTVRDRDTTAQVRVPVDRLADGLSAVLESGGSFERLLAEYDRVETDVTRT
jgi:glycyl-tRNA synthetase